ncbi:MAG: aspartate kinase [Deltaproteobacteria bacterium]|nr:aspartate kinase [Deltaproteobacteria bacterium]
MTRPIVVQKYGGSSVATTEKLRRVAELIVERKRGGADLVVVVSARGDTTDELLALAKEVSREPDRRELDMLLSAGERISMALLAMAIRELGFEAVSLTGSQSGIITNASHSQARIVEVRPFRVQDELALGKIVIVAGYQGVSYRRDVTTLGRGGSDTTAVALAAALEATACEIYSDVEGVFTADPRVVLDAKKLGHLGYEEMQELAESGAKVLNAAAVEFAKQRGIAIYARKTGSGDPGSVIRRDVPTSSSGVRGIAFERQVMTIEASGAPLPTVRALLQDLERLGAHPKQIGYAGGSGFSCVLALDDLHNDASVRERITAALGSTAVRTDRGAVSLIGEGITKEMGTLLKATATLEQSGASPLGISTSSFRITFLVPSPDVPRSVQLLHAAFELGRPSAEAALT